MYVSTTIITRHVGLALASVLLDLLPQLRSWASKLYFKICPVSKSDGELLWLMLVSLVNFALIFSLSLTLVQLILQGCGERYF